MRGVFNCRLTWNDLIQDKTIWTCAIDQEEGPRKEGELTVASDVHSRRSTEFRY